MLFIHTCVLSQGICAIEVRVTEVPLKFVTYKFQLGSALVKQKIFRYHILINKLFVHIQWFI